MLKSGTGSYRDYTVTVADTLPEGVTCERLS